MSTLKPADLERFLAEDAGGSVLLLNLLRFHHDSGSETYQKYFMAFAPMNARYGVGIIYASDSDQRALAAELGQA